MTNCCTACGFDNVDALRSCDFCDNPLQAKAVVARIKVPVTPRAGAESAEAIVAELKSGLAWVAARVAETEQLHKRAAPRLATPRTGAVPAGASRKAAQTPDAASAYSCKKAKAGQSLPLSSAPAVATTPQQQPTLTTAPSSSSSTSSTTSSIHSMQVLSSTIPTATPHATQRTSANGQQIVGPIAFDHGAATLTWRSLAEAPEASGVGLLQVVKPEATGEPSYTCLCVPRSEYEAVCTASSEADAQAALERIRVHALKDRRCSRRDV